MRSPLRIDASSTGWPGAATARVSIHDLETGNALANLAPGGHSGAAFSQFLTVVVDAEREAFISPDLGSHLVVVLRAEDMITDPSHGHRIAATARAGGHRVCLSGVGKSYPSLAILPLLRPDIIQVDLSLIMKQPDWQSAQTLNAISAYAEELPALVLAEAITTEHDRERALSIGATLGTGTFYQAGHRNSADNTLQGVSFATSPRIIPTEGTPFAVATENHPSRVGTRSQLSMTSHFLETCAFDCDEATVVLSTFQKSNNLNQKTADLYSALSRNLSYVFAFTHPTPDHPLTTIGIPDLRVRPFNTDHPLSLEWDVLIINARYQAMLAARETTTNQNGEQLFEYVLTHNRQTILQAAETLTHLL